jgi:16S rRNA (cytidine1402-2'-O)-methyltransferase
MLGKFYVVATPIGNLEDITLRALRILKEVDIVLCEDTRTTRVLLNKYEISTRCESYHSHSKDSKVDKIKEWLEEGKSLALVSDAGTPCISDPGVALISEIRATMPEIEIFAVPGATAFTALMSIAGVYADRFTFHGFVPHKKGRQTLIKEILSSKDTVDIVYESSHRIVKLLEELQTLENELAINKKVTIGRELTKFFEEVVQGSVAEVLEIVKSDSNKEKGEFVVMIS